jgi:hypothetical protein
MAYNSEIRQSSNGVRLFVARYVTSIYCSAAAFGLSLSLFKSSFTEPEKYGFPHVPASYFSKIFNESIDSFIYICDHVFAVPFQVFSLVHYYLLTFDAV